MSVQDHLAEAWSVVAPPRDGDHGPLPPLLVLLTVVTGLVDAFSYLALGHVLVANMTGNVVFLGFAVGGAAGFVWWASLLAVGVFLLGALAGGRVAAAFDAHRGRHLFGAVAIETTLVAAALVASAIADAPYADGPMALLVALLGVALGVQNATARALAVPDLTTTVLTLTLTGIAADSHAAGGRASKLGRRLVPVVSMFVGGVVGAVLVVHGRGSAALALATAILVVVTAVGYVVSRSHGRWVAKR